jgi:hypothetical protein
MSKEKINNLLLEITYNIFLATIGAPKKNKELLEKALEKVHKVEELCNEK